MPLVPRFWTRITSPPVRREPDAPAHGGHSERNVVRNAYASRMDTVWFVVDGRSGTTEITVSVSGTPLIDLARTVEQPWADREGEPHLAGSYLALGPWAIGGSSTHFLDHPHAIGSTTATVLLAGISFRSPLLRPRLPSFRGARMPRRFPDGLCRRTALSTVRGRAQRLLRP